MPTPATTTTPSLQVGKLGEHRQARIWVDVRFFLCLARSRVQLLYVDDSLHREFFCRLVYGHLFGSLLRTQRRNFSSCRCLSRVCLVVGANPFRSSPSPHSFHNSLHDAMFLYVLVLHTIIIPPTKTERCVMSTQHHARGRCDGF